MLLSLEILYRFFEKYIDSLALVYKQMGLGTNSKEEGDYKGIFVLGYDGKIVVQNITRLAKARSLVLELTKEG